MEQIGTFKTIDSISEGIFKDKGSKFLAFAFPMETETDLHQVLDQIKRNHPKARHFCYAYRIGFTKDKYRFNDDGEPSGTAGKPILNQIDFFRLTNVVVVVVRYFGGVLLGTSGLINAYKAAAHDAFMQANILEKTIFQCFSIQFDYKWMSNVMNSIKHHEVHILSQDFGIDGKMNLSLPVRVFEEKIIDFFVQIFEIHKETYAGFEFPDDFTYTLLGLKW